MATIGTVSVTCRNSTTVMEIRNATGDDRRVYPSETRLHWRRRFNLQFVGSSHAGEACLRNVRWQDVRGELPSIGVALNGNIRRADMEAVPAVRKTGRSHSHECAGRLKRPDEEVL